MQQQTDPAWTRTGNTENSKDIDLTHRAQSVMNAGAEMETDWWHCWDRMPHIHFIVFICQTRSYSCAKCHLLYRINGIHFKNVLLRINITFYSEPSCYNNQPSETFTFKFCINKSNSASDWVDHNICLYLNSHTCLPNLPSCGRFSFWV